jgi:hypothetical protein
VLGTVGRSGARSVIACACAAVRACVRVTNKYLYAVHALFALWSVLEPSSVCPQLTELIHHPRRPGHTLHAAKRCKRRKWKERKSEMMKDCSLPVLGEPHVVREQVLNCTTGGIALY